MCIIIDTNTLPSVFDKKSLNHHEFEPVYEWIWNGKGKVVYGGTKYVEEIGKYMPIFNELRRAKKAVYINNLEVDKQEISASSKIQHKDFDDQHLVGLLLESKCKLICSLDQRAYPYFRSSIFFNPSSKKPKIYNNKKNKKMLNDNNMAQICMPCAVTTNMQKTILSNIKF
jgi:hypothetical protein